MRFYEPRLARLMPGVEAADFDCPGCGRGWTAMAAIEAGFFGQAMVACPDCGQAMGTMRCDAAVPSLQPRQPGQSNLGFVRIYAADRTLMPVTPGRP